MDPLNPRSPKASRAPWAAACKEAGEVAAVPPRSPGAECGESGEREGEMRKGGNPTGFRSTPRLTPALRSRWVSRRVFRSLGLRYLRVPERPPRGVAPALRPAVEGGAEGGGPAPAR